MMSQGFIGVVTLTRNRPELLRRRAMASVYAQDYGGEIEHLIVSDDDPASMRVAAAAPTRPGLRVRTHLAPRPDGEVDEAPDAKLRGLERQARLCNLGVRLAHADWVAFLDDDNEYEPHHLSSLVATARDSGAEAVYSGRTMWRADGSPYLDERWHTVADPAEAVRIFDLMCDRGVRQRGTNLMMDRADAEPGSTRHFSTSSVIQPEDPVMLVDQSSWLIQRKLLLRLPIPEEFTEAEFRANTCADDKLLFNFVRNGVRVVSSGQCTVRYYLGGWSNTHLTAT